MSNSSSIWKWALSPPRCQELTDAPKTPPASQPQVINECNGTDVVADSCEGVEMVRSSVETEDYLSRIADDTEVISDTDGEMDADLQVHGRAVSQTASPTFTPPERKTTRSKEPGQSPQARSPALTKADDKPLKKNLFPESDDKAAETGQQNTAEDSEKRQEEVVLVPTSQADVYGRSSFGRSSSSQMIRSRSVHSIRLFSFAGSATEPLRSTPLTMPLETLGPTPTEPVPQSQVNVPRNAVIKDTQEDLEALSVAGFWPDTPGGSRSSGTSQQPKNGPVNTQQTNIPSTTTPKIAKSSTKSKKQQPQLLSRPGDPIPKSPTPSSASKPSSTRMLAGGSSNTTIDGVAESEKKDTTPRDSDRPQSAKSHDGDHSVEDKLGRNRLRQGLGPLRIVVVPPPVDSTSPHSSLPQLKITPKQPKPSVSPTHAVPAKPHNGFQNKTTSRRNKQDTAPQFTQLTDTQPLSLSGMAPHLPEDDEDVELLAEGVQADLKSTRLERIGEDGEENQEEEEIRETKQRDVGRAVLGMGERPVVEREKFSEAEDEESEDPTAEPISVKRVHFPKETMLREEHQSRQARPEADEVDVDSIPPSILLSPASRRKRMYVPESESEDDESRDADQGDQVNGIGSTKRSLSVEITNSVRKKRRLAPPTERTSDENADERAVGESATSESAPMKGKQPVRFEITVDVQPQRDQQQNVKKASYRALGRRTGAKQPGKHGPTSATTSSNTSGAPSPSKSSTSSHSNPALVHQRRPQPDEGQRSSKSDVAERTTPVTDGPMTASDGDGAGRVVKNAAYFDGEYVWSIWRDGQYYPAVVSRVGAKGKAEKYVVAYVDGDKWVVDGSNMRPLDLREGDFVYVMESAIIKRVKPSKADRIRERRRQMKAKIKKGPDFNWSDGSECSSFTEESDNSDDYDDEDDASDSSNEESESDEDHENEENKPRESKGRWSKKGKDRGRGSRAGEVLLYGQIVDVVEVLKTYKVRFVESEGGKKMTKSHRGQKSGATILTTPPNRNVRGTGKSNGSGGKSKKSDGEKGHHRSSGGKGRETSSKKGSARRGKSAGGKAEGTDEKKRLGVERWEGEIGLVPLRGILLDKEALNDIDQRREKLLQNVETGNACLVKTEKDCMSSGGGGVALRHRQAANAKNNVERGARVGDLSHQDAKSVLSSGGNRMSASKAATTMGPMPRSNDVFKGIYFVVSIPKATDGANNKTPSHGGDSGSRNHRGDGHDVSKRYVDKAYVLRQIEAGGGTLISDTQMQDHAPRAGATNSTAHDEESGLSKASLVALVTTRPCRTKKYLMALALSVPILSTSWIRDSCIMNEVQDYEKYRLSNGWSTDLMHYSNARYNTDGVFRDLFVYVHGNSIEFRVDWACILRAGGATLLSKKDIIDLKHPANLVGRDVKRKNGSSKKKNAATNKEDATRDGGDAQPKKNLRCDYIVVDSEPSKSLMSFFASKTDAAIVSTEVS
ncbi:hypothetical protein HK102_006094 [Quaeritorhiza haematococci]|nr:hypothetical protein HK102_006094 [Quaeritorhiza haematococci]